jgi:hypothetical protein
MSVLHHDADEHCGSGTEHSSGSGGYTDTSRIAQMGNSEMEEEAAWVVEGSRVEAEHA